MVENDYYTKIKERFLSTDQLKEIVKQAFGNSLEPKEVKSIYQSTEETQQDVQRLIMLEDFEGLKKRVMQLFKEKRVFEDAVAKLQVENQELREQLIMRENALAEVEDLNQKNADEFGQTMKSL